jgi:hypothetical protein
LPLTRPEINHATAVQNSPAAYGSRISNGKARALDELELRLQRWPDAALS